MNILYTGGMSRRTDMLASVVRDLVAPILRECPQECGIVSITDVEISKDASYATLLISAFKEPERALEFLQSQTIYLQRKMSELQRKRIPLIRFRLDRSGERGSRIDELLRQM